MPLLLVKGRCNSQFWPLALLAFVTATASCQTAHRTRKHLPESTAATVTAVNGTLAPSQRQAEPAVVNMADGSLTVDANNSELRQILGDISRQSGMIVQGNIPNIRVFGHYGPQNPSVILSDLLSGLGYNIAMAGVGRYGEPKELLLTDRTTAVSPPSTPKIEEEMKEALGPGAIAHPPAKEIDDPQLRGYQHDQKLQHMHDVLEKQQVAP